MDATVKRSKPLISLPVLVIIGFIVGALLLMAGAAFQMITSQPSSADFTVQATTGDQKAGAQYAEPAPEVITAKKITFVATTYMEPRSAEQISDIGEYVVSFALHLGRGEIEQAAEFMAVPNYQELHEAASFFDDALHQTIAQEGITIREDAILRAIPLPGQLGDYDDIRVGEQDFIPAGRAYQVAQGIYVLEYIGVVVTVSTQKGRLNITTAG